MSSKDPAMNNSQIIKLDKIFEACNDCSIIVKIYFQRVFPYVLIDSDFSFCQKKGISLRR